jgi:hypothetical protein
LRLDLLLTQCACLNVVLALIHRQQARLQARAQRVAEAASGLEHLQASIEQALTHQRVLLLVFKLRIRHQLVEQPHAPIALLGRHGLHISDARGHRANKWKLDHQPPHIEASTIAAAAEF